jgi:hypothetical protein
LTSLDTTPFLAWHDYPGSLTPDPLTTEPSGGTGAAKSFFEKGDDELYLGLLSELESKCIVAASARSSRVSS